MDRLKDVLEKEGIDLLESVTESGVPEDVQATASGDDTAFGDVEVVESKSVAVHEELSRDIPAKDDNNQEADKNGQRDG